MDQVNLGEGWRQFAFAGTDLDFIGVIRRGMEIGALARDKNGTFLQVNGDIRKALNASRVQALLRSARPERVRPSVVNMPSAEQRAAVVITVKAKRRLIVRD